MQHFEANYGPGGIGLLVQPLLGEAIQLILSPHSVLVLRDGDTLNLIAERYGTTVATLRRINPQLESTQTTTAVEGDSLAVLAGRHGTTETKLRSLNPVLQQSGMHLLVPGFMPSTPLPTGEWIDLPGEWRAQWLMPPPGPGAPRRA